MIDINLNERLDSIRLLAQISEAEYGIVDGEITSWSKGEKPTEEEIQSKIDSISYARNRAPAYPSVGDQLDMMMKDMKDGTTTHQEACEAVKAKYPKP